MGRCERFAPASILFAILMAVFPVTWLVSPPQTGPLTPALAGPPTTSGPAEALHLRLGTIFSQDVPPPQTASPDSAAWGVPHPESAVAGALSAADPLAPNAIVLVGQALVLPPLSLAAPAADWGMFRVLEPRISPLEALPRVQLSMRSFRADTLAGHLRLLRPSLGTVTSRFGWRIHPIFGTPEFHTGVDIATRLGSPVIAARSGVIRFAGWRTGNGWLVIIDHGSGLETLYSHLSKLLVRPGQRVTQGKVIGRIGSTGWSTGPHLFFEVRRHGMPEDPARYLN